VDYGKIVKRFIRSTVKDSRSELSSHKKGRYGNNECPAQRSMKMIGLGRAFESF
jgi:hypothetical protein